MENIAIVSVPNTESTMQIITVPVISCNGCPELNNIGGGCFCGIDEEFIPEESADIIAECFKLIK